MVAIVTTRTRTRGDKAPVGRFSINKDHWQAQGLLAWFPLAGNFHNYAVKTARDAITLVGGRTFAPYPGHGLAYSRIAGQRLQMPIKLTSDVICTMTGWMFKTIDANFVNVMSVGVDAGDSANNSHELLITNTEVVRARSQDGAGGGSAADGTTAVALAPPLRFFAGRINGAASRQAFLDGVQQATNTGSRSVTGIDTFFLGSTAANGSTSASSLRDLRVYDRALSDAEIYALYAPRTRWDLYWQPGRKTYILPSTTTAVTVSSGTLTLTGNTATVTFALTRAVTSGTVTLTQTSPTVSRTLNRAVTSGTATLTQTSPGVAQKRNIAPTSGTWTLTGSTATVTFVVTNYIVTAGTLSATGNTASVTLIVPPAPAAGGDGGAGFARAVISEVFGRRRQAKKSETKKPEQIRPAGPIYDTYDEREALKAIDSRIEDLEEEGVDLMSLPSAMRAEGQLRQIEEQIETLSRKRLALLLLLGASDAF